MLLGAVDIDVVGACWTWFHEKIYCKGLKSIHPLHDVLIWVSRDGYGVYKIYIYGFERRCHFKVVSKILGIDAQLSKV
jgi:hypothetical protein